MTLSRSSALTLIGFILVLVGFVLPLLIVIKILPSTFALNFLAYIASISGLFLGIIGVAERFVSTYRRR